MTTQPIEDALTPAQQQELERAYWNIRVDAKKFLKKQTQRENRNAKRNS